MVKIIAVREWGGLRRKPVSTRFDLIMVPFDWALRPYVPFDWALRAFPHTWILGRLPFEQVGMSMFQVYSRRGWVKFGLVFYNIYKFSLSVNAEDYVLWTFTFLSGFWCLEKSAGRFGEAEEIPWVTWFHWLRQKFKKLYLSPVRAAC